MQVSEPLPSSLVANPNSYVDPAGCVFELNGRILRGIRPDFADFYRSTLNNRIVKQLQPARLVETTVFDGSMETFPLVLEHHRIEPVSYCFEWPAQMLKDAALLTLDICLALNHEQMTLQDGYPWNVLFDCTDPVFVDFTSIVLEHPNLLWVAYDQFSRFFLFPLVVAEEKSGKVMRALLNDYVDGISWRDLTLLLSWRQLLKMRWLISSVLLPNLLLSVLRKTNSERAVMNMSRKMRPTSEVRGKFFESLKQRVLSIPLKIQTSYWSVYYADIETFFTPAKFNRKQSVIASILSKLKPQTVVDIGCNQGGYAVLAAHAGARVIAFDKDDQSIAMLYRLAKDRNLKILPLVMDFLCPSPASGWRGKQFAAAAQRFRSEMAFTLALIHHLAITQRQNFDRIAPALADYGEKYLLTEFIPLSDPRAVELLVSNHRDLSWYTLDNFIAALSRFYSKIETFPSDPDDRVLVLCSK